ncbi:nitrate regulatory protein [Salinicola rhizosphaerae]|uniref:Transcriptional regulator n=1 Tax=Salinicola rhizosphaerae TaxID=1443141 RepID=A0ABQ3E2L4_9GAMM|nr:nitrate regulatory protein [Salinicola rhizosphaerae]GHB21745.1 transcriptional regulator [Salinicola rhizosphaerae]
MIATEQLLRTAKRAEIEQLTRLADTAAIVGDLSRLVHALQRERGASSIYLGSHGQRFTEQRHQRIADSQGFETTLRQRLDAWISPIEEGAKPLADARLFKRIAAVWHGLDALPAIRAEIETQRLGADDATRLFNRVIANLLSVVFEAADTASDPDITRVLVCLFHFIQGKELAGQERACGALGFTLGTFDEAHRHTLQQLIDAQQRCFDTFAEFASPALLERWQAEVAPPIQEAVTHLRDLAIHDSPLPRKLDSPGEQWYAITTQRIDAMKTIENLIVDELQSGCRERTRQAEHDINDIARLRESLETESWAAPVNLLREPVTSQSAPQFATLTTNAIESRFDRSLIDLVQTQNARLQQISDELESTRKTLRDRKRIERAKGLLMEHQQLSEEQAYRLLRKTAMDQSKPLVEVAGSVIDLVAMLDRSAQ